MIIDAHVHSFCAGYFPPEWFDARARQWAASAWPQRDPEAIRDKVEAGLLDPHSDMLVSDLSYAGIDGAVCIGLDPWPVLSTSSMPGGADTVDMQASTWSEHRRLTGFVGLDPSRPDVGDLLERSFDDGRFVGVKIYPPHGYRPDDPRYDRIYAFCAQRQLPVMIHTALARYPLRSEYASPLLVQEVQWSHPDLTIVLAHGGFPVWHREAAVVAAGHDRTFIDISNWNKLLENDQDRVGDVLRMWRDDVGAHRLLFGSDHFSGARFTARRALLARWVKFVRDAAGFDPDEARLVLGQNIARILDWQPSFTNRLRDES